MTAPSVALGEPVSVAVTPAVLAALHAADIAFTSSMEVFDQGKGWLADLPRYTFRHRLVIEGPSAFYGGLYQPNPWTPPGGLCAMGAASYSHSPLPEGMIVGRYCSIGRGLRFLDFSHPTRWLSSSVAFFWPEEAPARTSIHSLIDREGRRLRADFTRARFDPREGRPYPVLEHDVWLGENVTLALGVTIGTGAVVASGAIVTRDVPPYAVASGAPAGVSRLRFPKEIVDRLLASRWWHYHFADLAELDVTRLDRFLERFDRLREHSSLEPWKPPSLTLPDAFLEARP